MESAKQEIGKTYPWQYPVYKTGLNDCQYVDISTHDKPNQKLAMSLAQLNEQQRYQEMADYVAKTKYNRPFKDLYSNIEYIKNNQPESRSSVVTRIKQCQVVVTNGDLLSIRRDELSIADVVIDAEGRCIKNRYGLTYHESEQNNVKYKGYKMERA